MADFDGDDDDFGHLYADVEAHASSAITSALCSIRLEAVEPEEEEGDKFSAETPSAGLGLRKDGELGRRELDWEESGDNDVNVVDDGSESEDDFNIVLNDDDCEFRGGAREGVVGFNVDEDQKGDDDFAGPSEGNDSSKKGTQEDQLAEGLEQNHNIQIVNDRRNGVKVNSNQHYKQFSQAQRISLLGISGEFLKLRQAILRREENLTIGHALNLRDAVLLQSLALLEYNNSTADLARVLFRRASEIDPRHQPIWIAWGWMEWKEGNIDKAREYYRRTLSIDSTNDGAARCLQAWGVLEQKLGNVSAARRLFRSSLNINSQSYVTWMTWASMEEGEGNPIRAEEIRNLYYQRRTEVVDDASWIMGFLDIIDPALERIKKLLRMDRETFKGQDPRSYITQARASRFEDGDEGADEEASSPAPVDMDSGTGFDLDAFVKKELSESVKSGQTDCNNR